MNNFIERKDYLDKLLSYKEKDIMQRHTIYDKRAFANVTKYIAGIIGSQVAKFHQAAFQNR
ncbi:hypothetical protein FACS189413_11900 [Bacteroidia bacterium]|nr:hypothetical protein FACS189413_11900 [Bacteroidia bacterium]